MACAVREPLWPPQYDAGSFVLFFLFSGSGFLTIARLRGDDELTILRYHPTVSAPIEDDSCIRTD